MTIFASLRARLLALMLLAVLPAFGLIIYSSLQERQSAARAVQVEAQRLIRLMASQHERFIEGARQLLTALAQLPAVRQRDGAGCSALFADFLRRYPFYANLGAVDLDGDTFCSGLRLTRPVNLADRAYVKGALQTRDFAIGEYQIGRITGKASVNFGYPFVDDAGTVQGAVFAALDLVWLKQLAAEAQLPSGATLTLFDRNGTVLVHHPSALGLTGTSAADTPLVKSILNRREADTVQAPNLDGVMSLFAFAPIGGSRLDGYTVYLAVGIPTAVAFADVNRAFIRNLLVFAVVALLALAAAWWFGNRLILGPARILLTATERLQSGDLGARTGLSPGHGELGQLAQAFDHMAERLQDREARLSQTLSEVTELKDLLDNVFSSIVSGVITLDLQGNITLCNQAALHILGVASSGQLVGKNVADALPALGTPLLHHVLSIRRTEKPVIGLEMSLPLPERGALHLRFNLSALKAAEQIQGVAIVVDDVTEKKQMEAQRRLLEHMVSPAILNQIDPDHLQLGGQRHEITLVFADIHGFTGISEQLNAEDLVGLLNRYLAAMANAVLAQEGTIDKFLGDAVMAWFNAPLPQPDHVLRAVRAALAIRDAINALHREVSPIFRLTCGIGLHVGEAVLGLVGTKERVEYTAIGDDVNTAKRIQEHTGPHQILISAATYARVKDQVTVGESRQIQVKGKQKPLEVYELLGLK
ncbi:MAG TPA: adenylate/guanylate cyclase domain-containing protein [Candidatus Competibacteraceae bacterium]|nr:adenylate/guanylate cyclase domain-containing protein [Candidatus Competibacteraceae bacterium]